jgi:hypothetical protein
VASGKLTGTPASVSSSGRSEDGMGDGEDEEDEEEDEDDEEDI